MSARGLALLLPALLASVGASVGAAVGGGREPGGRGAPVPSDGVDTAFLRDVARDLASDAFAGRRTGTAGGRRAADYIVERCRGMGLLPLPAPSYRQPVPLTERSIDSAGTTVRITGPGVDTTFAYFADFVPDVGTAATLRGFEGELVYVGRAVDVVATPDLLPPLGGAVVLLRGELGAAVGAADTLRARGARGVLEVVADPHRYRLYRKTRGPTRLHLADGDVASSFIPSLPAVITGPRMTVTLYTGLTGVSAGSWNDALINGLASGLPRPRVLHGWRASVRFAGDSRPMHADNVACLLPGRDSLARDSAIVLAAHYDHLGVGVPDERGDSIYNGFADNAVGVAMALAIARSLTPASGGAAATPRHSLVLLFSVGEEQGLLGADWFVAHPCWPLSRITGVVNLDANAPAGRPRSWRVAGDEDAPLTALVEAEARRHGWEATPAPASPASDYYAFLRRGVPSVFFVPSGGSYEGVSLLASDSMRASMSDRYHQPDDEWTPDFPFAGIERYADFTRDVVRAMDEGAER